MHLERRSFQLPNSALPRALDRRRVNYETKFLSNATIVLVHAAWADASSWSAVIGPLLKAGIKVIAAQIPMTSLSDDVAALKVALERAGAGPILLVSHSYSGAAITALESDDRVRGLAYVAAMPPDEGETVGTRSSVNSPHEKTLHLEPDFYGLLWMSEEGMKKALWLPGHGGAKRNQDSSTTPDSDEVSWRSDTDAGMEDDTVVVSAG